MTVLTKDEKHVEAQARKGEVLECEWRAVVVDRLRISTSAKGREPIRRIKSSKLLTPEDQALGKVARDGVFPKM